jgi:hypothetical protein
MKASERERKQAIERRRQIEEYKAQFLRLVRSGQNGSIPQFHMTKLMAEQLDYENKLDRRNRRTA